MKVETALCLSNNPPMLSNRGHNLRNIESLSEPPDNARVNGHIGCLRCNAHSYPQLQCEPMNR